MKIRFHYFGSQIGGEITSFYVTGIEEDAFFKLGNGDREKHVLARIEVGGVVSPLLAKTWAEQMCNQLNQFDIANATVAKLA